jgi:uncharacterized membrane protein YphA (DoxX/SURF4 family)
VAEPETDPESEVATDDVDATPVKARRLYKVALMLDAKGWPSNLKPGWMAWAAAGTELVGGALILAGLFSRVWGSLGAVTEYGIMSIPIPEFNRIFTQIGLLVLATGVMLTGAGGVSLDRALFSGGADEDEEHLLHLG